MSTASHRQENSGWGCPLVLAYACLIVATVLNIPRKVHRRVRAQRS